MPSSVILQRSVVSRKFQRNPHKAPFIVSLQYRVNDAKTGEHMGYFFLDLYPRDGKFGHAAIFPLQPSCIAANGERQVRCCFVFFTKSELEIS